MAKQFWTAAAAEVYKENHLLGEGGKKQIREFLFPKKNEDRSSSFNLARFLGNGYACAYRNRDTQSQVRKMVPGEATYITVPQGSAKTPVSQRVVDAVHAAFQPSGNVDEQLRAKMADIVEDHVTGWNMRHNKQALDMFVNGVFTAPGEEGDDIGLDIDYLRDSGSSLAYDFTAVGASFSEALIEFQDAMIAAGVPLDNQFVFMGSDWRGKYNEDDVIKEWRKTQPTLPDVPEEFKGYEGLSAPKYVETEGMQTGIWVCFYQPGIPFKDSEDAADEPWIASDQMIGGSTLSVRYDVNRGMVVLPESGNRPEIVVGDIAFDYFNELDPVCTWERSNVRKALVPANVNHMFNSVGTFA